MNNLTPPIILQKGQYISHVIKDSQQWQRGQKVLINASTGTGKSEFIISYLYEIYRQFGFKTLFLTNRNALQEQFRAKYSNASVWIDFMNYQKLSTEVVHNKAFVHNKYAIIVADEAHYFFADAPFAMNTDRVLHYLLNDCNYSLRIFLSATTNILESYLRDFSSCDHAYSYIRPYEFDQLYYWRDYKTIEAFLKQIPSNEKVLFFTQKPNIALQVSKEFSNSSFVCAKNNPRYGRYSDTAILDELIKSERFSCQILFATSVIDNGINIKDDTLKHIIIDLFDYDSIIQCIGRRRASCNNSKVNIYIKQCRQPSVHTRIVRNMRMLEMVDDFKRLTRRDFCNKYGTRYKDGLIYTLAPNNQVDYYINYAKAHKLQCDLDTMNDMNAIDTRFGHLKLFCSRYYLNFNSFQDLSNKVTSVSLTDQLDAYVGIPLFDEDKKKFLEFMKKDVLHPLEGGYKIKTINAYFEDVKLPYRVEGKRQNSKNLDNFGKRYWMLTRV